jgi:hypothetical protein
MEINNIKPYYKMAKKMPGVIKPAGIFMLYYPLNFYGPQMV